jgi:hypothetical protein
MINDVDSRFVEASGLFKVRSEDGLALAVDTDAEQTPT